MLHDAGVLNDLTLLDCPCNGPCPHTVQRARRLRAGRPHPPDRPERYQRMLCWDYAYNVGYRHASGSPGPLDVRLSSRRSRPRRPARPRRLRQDPGGQQPEPRAPGAERPLRRRQRPVVPHPERRAPATRTSTSTTTASLGRALMSAGLGPASQQDPVPEPLSDSECNLSPSELDSQIVRASIDLASSIRPSSAMARASSQGTMTVSAARRAGGRSARARGPRRGTGTFARSSPRAKRTTRGSGGSGRRDSQSPRCSSRLAVWSGVSPGSIVPAGTSSSVLPTAYGGSRTRQTWLVVNHGHQRDGPPMDDDFALGGPSRPTARLAARPGRFSSAIDEPASGFGSATATPFPIGRDFSGSTIRPRHRPGSWRPR